MPLYQTLVLEWINSSPDDPLLNSKWTAFIQRFSNQWPLKVLNMMLFIMLNKEQEAHKYQDRDNIIYSNWLKSQENLKHHNQARERSVPSNIRSPLTCVTASIFPPRICQHSEGSNLLGVCQAAPESPPRWRSKRRHMARRTENMFHACKESSGVPSALHSETPDSALKPAKCETIAL